MLERIRPKAGRVEETGDHPWDLYEELADQGILALAIPEEYGGSAHDTLSFNVCIEELARVSGRVSLGTGFKAAMKCFDFSRPCVAAQAVGLAQGAVDLALDYASRRQVFGQPLAMHEGVQTKLASMEAEILSARALAYQAAAMVDEGHPRVTKFASAAKLVASEVAMRVTTQGVDVLGGNGYLRGFPAERMMRDAKVLQIYEGANDIQRLVLAREMAGEAQSRDPVWPEWMPGAPGVASGEGPEAQAEQAGAEGQPASV